MTISPSSKIQLFLFRRTFRCFSAGLSLECISEYQGLQDMKFYLGYVLDNEAEN